VSVNAEAIQDREITQEELDKLSNLMVGLAIPQNEVQRQFDIVREIIDTQALRLPFEPIPPGELAAPKQKGEDAFYQCSALVLSNITSLTRRRFEGRSIETITCA